MIVIVAWVGGKLYNNALNYPDTRDFRSIEMAKVEIYTTHICGFCERAKQLLSQKGTKFTDINIMMNTEKREEMIKRSNGSTTVPQIFIGDRHIGGCDELFDLEYDGSLDKLLS